VHQVNSFI
jgi:hypothetical protein